MAHLHEVRDSDTHFIIDPITRVITNTAAAKNRLMQGDHNSEVFTFEIPKTVEFHDMNLCNKVEIHYINVAADKTGTSTDVYDVQDFGAAEDDTNAYAFSWCISDNATKYAGTLNFRIRFACVDGDGNYNYRWHTDIFKGITIADGFDNAPAVIADYSDVLEQWKVDLQNSVTPEKIDAAVTKYLDANPIEHPIERIESLDAENLVNFRDLESGNYIIYGYFSPYANSDISISADNSLISVIKKAAGTHVICLDPLNAKIVFFEILVDETAEKGYTYTRTIMPVLELNALIEKVGNLEELTTNDKANLVTAINEAYNKIPDIKPLAFTGAVEAEYDGSEATNIEIPKGGGEWVLLAEKTFTEADLGTESLIWEVDDAIEVAIITNNLLAQQSMGWHLRINDVQITGLNNVLTTEGTRWQSLVAVYRGLFWEVTTCQYNYDALSYGNNINYSGGNVAQGVGKAKTITIRQSWLEEYQVTSGNMKIYIKK